VKRTAVLTLFLLTLEVLALAQDKVPKLTLHNLAGEKVKLGDYRGKVVVLNFWATWCGPCREELPMLVAAEKAWSRTGAIFIAVSLDDNKTKANIPAFVAQYHLGFPVWTGASTDELDTFHLGQGVPDTVFIDESGTIVARVLGEIRRDELDERLAWLTGGRKSPRPAALINHMAHHASP
jgi:thiol-disulfide isomerase/thioredoxin